MTPLGESAAKVRPRNKPIAINGRFLTQGTTGVQRYAREVTRWMDRLLTSGELDRPDSPVEILVPPGTGTHHGHSFFQVRECGWGSGQLWEQVSLPLACRGRVLFTPSGGSPLLHGSNVFTLPDISVLATPDAYTRAYRTWYGTHHRLAVLDPGLRLLTVSRFSRSEIARYLHLPEANIQVTTEGHEHVFDAAADAAILDRLALNPGTFVLAVGSSNPNKNFATLLQAFELFSRTAGANIRLVIVGGSNPGIFGASGQVCAQAIRAGYVSDGELRALYEAAGCFCFPSLYEGFGLPPLEAMALGCPVICSNAASMPEVCGDAADLVDPLDAESMAAAIGRAFSSNTWREKQIAAGRRQSSKFRWSDAAAATWSILLQASENELRPSMPSRRIGN